METQKPDLVCYCFNFSRKDIQEEFQKIDRSKIRDFISSQIKAGNCRCEELNPKKHCCLGDVNAVIKPLQKGGNPSCNEKDFCKGS